ncbi:unnamed protein product, partial [Allacma fusca]
TTLNPLNKALGPGGSSSGTGCLLFGRQLDALVEEEFCNAWKIVLDILESLG